MKNAGDWNGNRGRRPRAGQLNFEGEDLQLGDENLQPGIVQPDLQQGDEDQPGIIQQSVELMNL